MIPLDHAGTDSRLIHHRCHGAPEGVRGLRGGDVGAVDQSTYVAAEGAASERAAVRCPDHRLRLGGCLGLSFAQDVHEGGMDGDEPELAAFADQP
jgi:hypothetical protein